MADRVALRSARCSTATSSSRERVDAAARVEAGLPQRLVGEQVADPGEHRLVEQPRLERRRATGQPLAELGDADLPGVRPERVEVGVEHGACQPALVEEPQDGAALEGDGEAVPLGLAAAAAAPDRVAALDGGPSGSVTMIRPAIPRCSPSTGPDREVSHHIVLPRRWAPVSWRPTSASRISPGACGRQT